MIPLTYRILAFVLILTAFGWFMYNKGVTHAETQQELAVSAAKDEAYKKGVASVKVTTKIEVQYKDRIVTNTKTVYKYRERINEEVPADAVLPAVVVGLLDNQVRDSERNAGSPGIPDEAAPAVDVDLRSATQVISDNYGICYAWRSQLEALQDWLKVQKEILQTPK